MLKIYKKIKGKIMEELEEILVNLKHYRSIFQNEGKEKYEKSIFIINAYIEFILNLKIDYVELDEYSEDYIAMQRILNEIKKFIIKINQEIGYN